MGEEFHFGLKSTETLVKQGIGCTHQHEEFELSFPGNLEQPEDILHFVHLA